MPVAPESAMLGLMAPMPSILMRSPRSARLCIRQTLSFRFPRYARSRTSPELQCGFVGFLGPVDHREIRLVAALRHHHLAHLAAEVDVGVADVALGVGERVVGLVDDPALGVAAGHHAGHLDAGTLAGGPVAHRLGLHVPGLERFAAGGAGVVHVRQVVRDGVEPLAVDGEAGTGDADRGELGQRHQAPLPLMTVLSRPNLLSMARRAVWYRRLVFTDDNVSSSMLTLLPSSRVGSSDDWTAGPTSDGLSPLAMAWLRASSKETLLAWKFGVSMFAMLFAVTRWRMDRPASAVCSATEVASPSTERGSLRRCGGVSVRRSVAIVGERSVLSIESIGRPGGTPSSRGLPTGSGGPRSPAPVRSRPRY